MDNLQDGKDLEYAQELKDRVNSFFERARRSREDLVHVAEELGGLHYPASDASQFESPDVAILRMIADRVVPPGCEYVVRQPIGGSPEIIITGLG